VRYILKRIDDLIRHTHYQLYLSFIRKSEKNRIFCEHDLSHFLDTARIAYIINLENGLGYTKEILYAAALLHDIGRWEEYEKNIPHETASANLAKPIMVDVGFCDSEITMVVDAILVHGQRNSSSLGNLLYLSDKKSRLCQFCQSEKKCNWDDEKKNKGIVC